MMVERLQGAASKFKCRRTCLANVGLEQDTSNLEYIDQQVIRKGSHFFGVEPVISRDELERLLSLALPMLINYMEMDYKWWLLVI